MSASSIISLGYDAGSNFPGGFIGPAEIRPELANRIEVDPSERKDLIPVLAKDTTVLRLSLELAEQLEHEINYYLTDEEVYVAEEIQPRHIWCPGSLHVCFQAIPISEKMYALYKKWGIFLTEFPVIEAIFKNQEFCGIWSPALDAPRYVMNEANEKYTHRALDNLADVKSGDIAKNNYILTSISKYRHPVYSFRSHPRTELNNNG